MLKLIFLITISIKVSPGKYQEHKKELLKKLEEIDRLYLIICPKCTTNKKNNKLLYPNPAPVYESKTKFFEPNQVFADKKWDFFVTLGTKSQFKLTNFSVNTPKNFFGGSFFGKQLDINNHQCYKCSL